MDVGGSAARSGATLKTAPRRRPSQISWHWCSPTTESYKNPGVDGCAKADVPK